MIVPRYYEDLDFLHEHTMSPRAYYIPASHRMEDLESNDKKYARIKALEIVIQAMEEQIKKKKNS